MQFATIKMSEDQIQILEQNFLSVGIEISKKQIAELSSFQQALCKKLEWIELDEKKLYKIIHQFLHANDLHNGNFMVVLKTVISSYYIIRQCLDYHSSDEDIYQTLYEEFLKFSGLSISSLQNRAKKKLIERGGQYCDELFNTIG